MPKGLVRHVTSLSRQHVGGISTNRGPRKVHRLWVTHPDGLGSLNDNFFEVCFHGWFKSPCDCRAAERGCPDLPFHYIKASICGALHCIRKRKKATSFQTDR